MKLSRRLFLKNAAAGSSLVTFGRALPAFAASNFKALICLELLGGLDNFLVALPLENARKNALIAQRGAEMTAYYNDPNLLQLGYQSNLAMHPGLKLLQPYLVSTRLTLGGVNCAAPNVNPTRSHELAQARAALGTKEGGGASIGWKGRLYDAGVELLGFDGAKSQNFNCKKCGTTPPTVVTSFEKFKVAGQQFDNAQGGLPNAMHVESIMRRMVGSPLDRVPSPIEEKYRSGLSEMFNGVDRIEKTAAYTTPNNDNYPATELGTRFRNIAQSLKQALDTGASGPRLYVLAQNGYDFHDNFVTRADSLLSSLALALRAFLDDCALMGILDNVVVTTETDFGRQIKANGAGTDHGEGMCTLTIGGRVNGGSNIVWGDNLTANQIATNDAWPKQLDARAIICEILERHLGVDPYIAFPGAIGQEVQRQNLSLFI